VTPPSSSKPGPEVQPSKRETPAPAAGTGPAEAGEPPAVQKLSPEEQMALFEKELKENDWGHQPC